MQAGLADFSGGEQGMQTLAKRKNERVFDGAKLRELRESKEMTLAELGELVGKSAPDVSRYERGLVVPSADVLFKLADALGVKTDDLRKQT
jgi:transcriptional regulator with XRE-family HTH domain